MALRRPSGCIILHTLSPQHVVFSFHAALWRSFLMRTREEGRVPLSQACFPQLCRNRVCQFPQSFEHERAGGQREENHLRPPQADRSLAASEQLHPGPVQKLESKEWTSASGESSAAMSVTDRLVHVYIQSGKCESQAVMAGLLRHMGRKPNTTRGVYNAVCFPPQRGTHICPAEGGGCQVMTRL